MGKALRTFHLLAADATADDTHGEDFRCGVGGHPHLNFEEIYGRCCEGCGDPACDRPTRAETERKMRQLGAAFKGRGGLLASGDVVWLCFPSVLKLTQCPAEAVPVMMASDISARHGQYVAAELARSSAYAARTFADPAGGPRGCHPLEVPGGPLGEPAQGRLALAWPHLFVNQVSTRRRF
jgi:hypothetical protein